MYVMSLLTFSLLALPAAFAHPGHDLTEEAAERAAFMKRSPNTVRSCASQLERRGALKAALARRQAIAQKARVKRGLTTPLVRRDFAAAFAQRPRDEWVAELGPGDTCVSEVASVPELVHDELLTLDEVLARIDAVSVEEVRAVAAEVLARPEVLAVVGPA